MNPELIFVFDKIFSSPGAKDKVTQDVSDIDFTPVYDGYIVALNYALPNGDMGCVKAQITDSEFQRIENSIMLDQRELRLIPHPNLGKKQKNYYVVSGCEYCDGEITEKNPAKTTKLVDLISDYHALVTIRKLRALLE